MWWLLCAKESGETFPLGLCTSLEPEKLDHKLTNSEIQLPQLEQTVNYTSKLRLYLHVLNFTRLVFAKQLFHTGMVGMPVAGGHGF